MRTARAEKKEQAERKLLEEQQRAAQENLEKAIGSIKKLQNEVDSQLEQILTIGVNIFRYAREVRNDPRLERETRQMLEIMASARNMIRKFRGLRYMEGAELEQYHEESTEFYASKQKLLQQTLKRKMGV